MIKKFIIVILVVFGAIAVTAASFEVTFADQLPYGVYVDGATYPKYNRAMLMQAISQKIQNYDGTGVTLFMGEKTKTVKLSEIGITFDISATADRAFNIFSSKYPLVGSATLAYTMLMQENKIPLTIVYDESVLKDYLQKNIHPFFDTVATDATLSFDQSPTTINAESAGQIVEDKQLRLLLDSTIASHQTTLAVPMIRDSPDVTATDLVQAAGDADAMFARKLTLLADTKRISPKKEAVAGWLAIISESNALRTKPDANKIENYLTKLAPTVNKKAKNQVSDTNQNVITAGANGVSLNVDKSVQAMMDGLVGDKSTDNIVLVTATSDFKTLTYDPQEGGTAGLTEGKYVEINLSKQKMYLYDGQTFVNSFAVSTGKWSTPTPTGTYAIYNKIRAAYSKPYDLYMPYWSAITADGQYGIHGLPYKGSWIEGANHIGTPVSHGCVRLGPGNESYVYDWAPIGTPVFIHK